MGRQRERWRRIAGLSARYEVSDHGRVRSWNTCSTPRSTPLILTPNVNTETGHLSVALPIRRGVYKRRYVHQLVLEAFVGPCPKGLLSRHWDGVPRNNHLGNLLWGTHSENIQDAIRHGTATIGERNGLAKFTQAQAEEIRADPRTGEELTRVYAVSRATISRIRNGKRYNLCLRKE